MSKFENARNHAQMQKQDDGFHNILGFLLPKEFNADHPYNCYFLLKIWLRTFARFPVLPDCTFVSQT